MPTISAGWRIIVAVLLSGFLSACVTVKSTPMSALVKKDCVILLHGLTRSPLSMRKLEGFLEGQGYDVVNQGYNSRQAGIRKLAAPTINEALFSCPKDAVQIHFVTHSLGGILVRQYLANNEIANLGRVVMLAPPNQGSEVPDILGEIPGFNLLNGPAGAQLGTDEDSIPLGLPDADFDLGIIAGDKSINLILSQIIPEEDDGKVSIESTKLEGMNDHIIMPVSHPMIMRDDNVLEQVLYYLKNGYFDHEAEKTYGVQARVEKMLGQKISDMTFADLKAQTQKWANQRKTKT